jgi:prepilin-type N-terminal cleavage/methylation domain-containing protein
MNPTKQSQTGFSLLELSLAIALAAMVSIGYLYNQTRDTEFNTAKAQAGYFLTVNDAVGKYMLSFYDDLNNKSIETACSAVNLTAGNTPAPTTAKCVFQSGSASGVLSPANVMQPTVAELQKLGMLDKSFQDSFLWPTLSTVNRPYASNCDPKTAACTTTANAAPAAYATRIQKWCDGVLVTPANNLSCATPQLKSLTFNSQPFADADIGSFFKMARFEKLNTAISSMGGDGLMSLELALDNEGKGKLYGVGGKTSLDNPILFIDGKNASLSGRGRGIAGIMAIQNAAEVRCKAN